MFLFIVHPLNSHQSKFNIKSTSNSPCYKFIMKQTIWFGPHLPFFRPPFLKKKLVAPRDPWRQRHPLPWGPWPPLQPLRPLRVSQYAAGRRRSTCFAEGKEPNQQKPSGSCWWKRLVLAFCWFYVGDISVLYGFIFAWGKKTLSIIKLFWFFCDFDVDINKSSIFWDFVRAQQPKRRERLHGPSFASRVLKTERTFKGAAWWLAAANSLPSVSIPGGASGE